MSDTGTVISDGAWDHLTNKVIIDDDRADGGPTFLLSVSSSILLRVKEKVSNLQGNDRVEGTSIGLDLYLSLVHL